MWTWTYAEKRMVDERCATAKQISNLIEVVRDMNYIPNGWWVDRDALHQFVYQGA